MNKPAICTKLDTLNFDNRFINTLPADPVTDNYRRQVKGACFSFVTPRKASNPKLVSYSVEVADLIEIPYSICETTLFAEIFTGNRLVSGMTPFAMCYGGHQFGSWAGQLGDGRVINLGEVVNSNNQRWILQLKGAGVTPYSRSADGLAVLRSSVREYLCSEAMHHLGVPTTRALSLTTTGDWVERDMFYDGNHKNEPGAVVCRVSPSWLRFGSFEILASRKESRLLQQLVDYSITTDFPHLDTPSKDTYLSWFGEVCRLTAEMVIHWMRVGYVHGVMNTDNMSILGLTIDYGPYGWLEDYNPGWTPNTTDAQGKRYCFANQPHIAQWNLVQLANAIYPLINDREALGDVLDQYRRNFQQGWADCMAHKIGLAKFEPEKDDELINELLQILTLVETDMTIFFRKLADFESVDFCAKQNHSISFIKDAYYQPEKIDEAYENRMTAWLKRYADRLRADGADSVRKKEQMNKVNPKYVLRNYLVQLAIDRAEQGDYSAVNELLDLVRKPYDEQPQLQKYAVKRPDWARKKPGCSMLSCSS